MVPRPYTQGSIRLLVQAFTSAVPGLAASQVTRAIVRDGGWVIRHAVADEHIASMHFEFEMRSIVAIYSALVESGLQLTGNSHVRLATICCCAVQRKNTAADSLVGIGLEIHRSPISLVTRTAAPGVDPL